eukprot:CAMPEP_0197509180 /NCGR_PEP_ID=MMETSP1312-20131121/37814_1 /TAXON_ID=464262 /ORGANISM="Genus nov. species nov., Strain RCC2335" /LENGTH=119 /DNA_ID=CAMNT_0043057029 /DNA_START=657 /DNA_END=1016 /DNA_ORIENTATION=-
MSSGPPMPLKFLAKNTTESRSDRSRIITRKLFFRFAPLDVATISSSSCLSFSPFAAFLHARNRLQSLLANSTAAAFPIPLVQPVTTTFSPTTSSSPIFAMGGTRRQIQRWNSTSLVTDR